MSSRVTGERAGCWRDKTRVHSASNLPDVEDVTPPLHLALPPSSGICKSNVFDKRTSRTTDIWLTPPSIIRALGDFELDPASPLNRPWDTARHHYTELDDGLSKKWVGRIWLNPPYGSQTPIWLERLARHGNGIALIAARTETRYFHRWVWNWANAVFFFEGRIRFLLPDGSPAGSPTFPSCLVAYNPHNVVAIEAAAKRGDLKGKLVEVGGFEVL